MNNLEQKASPPPVGAGTAWEPPPPDFSDPVIEAFKKDVDRTLLRENLRLSVEERFRKFEEFMKFAQELSAAGRRRRTKETS